MPKKVKVLRELTKDQINLINRLISEVGKFSVNLNEIILNYNVSLMTLEHRQ